MVYNIRRTDHTTSATQLTTPHNFVNWAHQDVPGYAKGINDAQM